MSAQLHRCPRVGLGGMAALGGAIGCKRQRKQAVRLRRPGKGAVMPSGLRRMACASAGPRRILLGRSACCGPVSRMQMPGRRGAAPARDRRDQREDVGEHLHGEHPEKASACHQLTGTRRASTWPGNLVLAQEGEKGSPGSGMCGRKTGPRAHPGTPCGAVDSDHAHVPDVIERPGITPCGAGESHCAAGLLAVPAKRLRAGMKAPSPRPRLSPNVRQRTDAGGHTGIGWGLDPRDDVDGTTTRKIHQLNHPIETTHA